MNSKQSSNQQDETILLDMGDDTFFTELQFCQAREFLEDSFDTLKYLRIHFY